VAELWELTAHDLAGAIRRGEASSAEATESVLGRIEAVEDRVKAFITLTPEAARAGAAAADRARRGAEAGEVLSPLHGVPGALKDIICTRGIASTAASRILEPYVPPYSATVAERLDAAGLPVVGKTNLDEFAMGSSTENSGFFPTHNPWDLDRVPGGSSGGSAAAIAAGEALWSLGTDTGGSIRQPASLCGVVGLKPTYGLVPRRGLIAFASSLDQAGPITRDVRDAALILQLIAGHDPGEATSLPGPVPDYRAALEAGPDRMAGLRVGVVGELTGEGVQEGVRLRFTEAVRLLEKMGAEVGDVSLPTFEYGIDAYYLIAPAEASANLARYDGVRYGRRVDGPDVATMNARSRAAGFGPEVKRRIMLGTYALSAGYYDAYYGKAQKVRTLIIRDFARAYREFDVLVSPTSPTTAFRIGERTTDPLTMYLSDVCTVPTSLAGAAAISVPCGLAPEDGLPVGLQFMGPALSEPMLLGVAYAFEQELGFSDRPPIWSD
jgi:aspartyl-tRNA(Asn)/glutamyl-tRNA(Gln) amidotransferase subunit A